MDWLSGPFSLVNNIYVTGSLSLLILVIASISWLRLVRAPARNIDATLDQSTALLKGIQNPLSESAFASIDENMTNNPLLRRSWFRYREDLWEERLQSFRPASRAFSFENIVPDQMNLGLVDSIPNLLLGLGLLFTFIGLIAALYFASQGVSAASTEEAKKSLGDLLHAATFKFVTSLVGLACSMLFTLGERRRLNEVTSRITILSDELDRLLPVRGPLQLQVEALQESVSQTVQLKRFNTDLAASIAGELQGRLEPALQKTTENLTAAIFSLGQQLGDRLGDMNQEAIKQMLESFSETLHGQTEAQANALNESIAKQLENVAAVNSVISETPDRLKEQLASVLSTMNESTDTLTERLNSAAGAALGAFEDGAKRVTETFSNAVGSMGESLRSLDELVKTTRTELSDGIREFEATVRSLRDLSANLSETLASLERASLPIAESAKAMNDCVDQLVLLQETARNTMGQAMELSRTANLELRAVGTSLREISNGVAATVKQAFDSYSGRFNEVDKQFGEITASLEKMIETYQTRVNAFAGDLDAHLGKGMKNLSSGVKMLQEAIEELEDALNKSKSVA
jgi:methyl-accepting chemotaxis protein